MLYAPVRRSCVLSILVTEKIEKVIKNERPLVKRFIAKSYDGEFDELPLRVAGIVAQYIEDSI